MSLTGRFVRKCHPLSSRPSSGSEHSKTVPLIRQTAGALTMPVVAGASTYAVGKVFIQHFASWGTFLTFDPEKAKDYYAEMFREGKEIAKDSDDVAAESKKNQEKDQKDQKDEKRLSPKKP